MKMEEDDTTWKVVGSIGNKLKKEISKQTPKTSLPVLSLPKSSTAFPPLLNDDSDENETENTNSADLKKYENNERDDHYHDTNSRKNNMNKNRMLSPISPSQISSSAAPESFTSSSSTPSARFRYILTFFRKTLSLYTESFVYHLFLIVFPYMCLHACTNRKICVHGDMRIYTTFILLFRHLLWLYGIGWGGILDPCVHIIYYFQNIFQKKTQNKIGWYIEKCIQGLCAIIGAASVGFFLSSLKNRDSTNNFIYEYIHENLGNHSLIPEISNITFVVYSSIKEQRVTKNNSFLSLIFYYLLPSFCNIDELKSYTFIFFKKNFQLLSEVLNPIHLFLHSLDSSKPLTSTAVNEKNIDMKTSFMIWGVINAKISNMKTYNEDDYDFLFLLFSSFFDIFAIEFCLSFIYYLSLISVLLLSVYKHLYNKYIYIKNAELIPVFTCIALILLTSEACESTSGPMLSLSYTVMISMYRNDITSLFILGFANVLGVYTASKLIYRNSPVLGLKEVERIQLLEKEKKRELQLLKGHKNKKRKGNNNVQTKGSLTSLFFYHPISAFVKKKYKPENSSDSTKKNT